MKGSSGMGGVEMSDTSAAGLMSLWRMMVLTMSIQMRRKAEMFILDDNGTSAGEDRRPGFRPGPKHKSNSGCPSRIHHCRKSDLYMWGRLVDDGTSGMAHGGFHRTMVHR